VKLASVAVKAGRTLREKKDSVATTQGEEPVVPDQGEEPAVSGPAPKREVLLTPEPLAVEGDDDDYGDELGRRHPHHRPRMRGVSRRERGSGGRGRRLHPQRKTKAARLEYDPEPFEGARAAAGPSPVAQDTLYARGLMGPARPVEQAPAPAATVSRDAASKEKTGKPRAAAETTSKREQAVQPSRTQKRGQARLAAKGPQRKQSAPPRKMATRKTQTKRIARTVRLAPNVEAKLQQIAATFGVDLNAAVAIAITHGFKALGDAALVQPIRRVESVE